MKVSWVLSIAAIAAALTIYLVMRSGADTSAGGSTIRTDLIDNPNHRGGILADTEAHLEGAIGSTGPQINGEFQQPGGYQQLASSGSVMGIPQGTEVDVLSETPKSARVLVKSGLLSGKTGFVPPQVLKSSPYHSSDQNMMVDFYSPR